MSSISGQRRVRKVRRDLAAAGCTCRPTVALMPEADARAVGAVFGAMNTMYAIVAARTREIGTLRALVRKRRNSTLRALRAGRPSAQEGEDQHADRR